MDAKTEYMLFKRFEKLAKGKTTILVSHKFSTVRMADTIVVIDKGKVVEKGTHKELMKKGGRYAKMFKLQAEGYLNL
jgi:ATP-binding cassette subfamily B protein